jgi:group I intron endonuclease
MFHILYKVTNKVNGKFYVGIHSSVKLNDSYLGSGTVIKRSVAKYGKENHVKEVIVFAEDRNQLEYIESKVVNEELIAHPLCLNLKLGGKGGRILNEESKAAISKALTGIKHSSEAKMKMSIARKGKTFSEEHKRGISEAKKKRNRSMYKPLLVDGIEYYNVYDAVVGSGISRATVLRRIKTDDPKHSNTYYIIQEK